VGGRETHLDAGALGPRKGDHHDPTRRGHQAASTIRPFRVDVPQADFDDLRQRFQATRWPDKETVADDVVIPSLPGYGFSSRPAEIGWGPDRIARAWVVLMQRLDYTQFVAQGGE
jgi:hypothetical protein